MLGISLKMEGIKGFFKALENPFGRVMAMTLNTVGEEIYNEQEKIAHSSFKTFNTYSRRSLFFYKTKEDQPLVKQNIVVGSYSPYLRRLEYGFKPSLRASLNISGVTGTEGLHGRWIASKLSRKSNGTINPKYTLQKLQDSFVAESKYGMALVKRNGKKLIRLWVLKKQVNRVKAYRWHSRAVNNKFKEGKIRDTFAKIWSS